MYFCSWVLSGQKHEQSQIEFAGITPTNVLQYLFEEVTQCYMLCRLPCPSSLPKLTNLKKSLNSTSDETMRSLEGKQVDLLAKFMLSRKYTTWKLKYLKLHEDPYMLIKQGPVSLQSPDHRKTTLPALPLPFWFHY